MKQKFVILHGTKTDEHAKQVEKCQKVFVKSKRFGLSPKKKHRSGADPGFLKGGWLIPICHQTISVLPAGKTAGLWFTTITSKV